MKNIICLICTLILSIASILSCQKKCIPPPESELDLDYALEYSNIFTSIKTYRNDVPSPPSIPWSKLDTSNLDICQDRLWGYLKTMYPTKEENYWNYNTYSIQNEPDEVFANRAFIGQHIRFFGDTIYSRNGLLGDTTRPCINVDSTFFLQAVGPPTFKSYLGDQQVTYFYFFKLKYRHGPCPHIFNIGNDFEHFGQMEHFSYCATMRVSFLQESGRMVYIDFLGSG